MPLIRAINSKIKVAGKMAVQNHMYFRESQIASEKMPHVINRLKPWNNTMAKPIWTPVIKFVW